jgi:hypothetical protein
MEFRNIKSMVALCVRLVHLLKNSDGRSEVSGLVIIITKYFLNGKETKREKLLCTRLWIILNVSWQKFITLLGLDV